MSKKKIEPTPGGYADAQNDVDYTYGAGTAPVSASNGKAPPLLPRERFKKYADRRRDRVLKALGRLGNLSNRRSYEYTDRERDMLLAQIDAAVLVVRERFAGVRRTKTLPSLFDMIEG